MAAIIIITGNLARDAELKFSNNGGAILNFSLGVNTGFKDNKHCSWWRCSMFGQRAEKMSSFLTKGKKLLVEGEPTIKKFTNKDGEDKYYTQVFVKNIEFLSSGNQDGDVINTHHQDDEAVPF